MTSSTRGATTRTRRPGFLALLVLWLCMVAIGAACSHGDDSPPPALAPTVDDAHVVETDGGLVKATVSVSPKAPRLGDVLTLVLTVDAAAGVQVTMPAFGEALGRFALIDFLPADESLAAGGAWPDGGKRFIQRYTLEPAMTGRQRIPSLRVVYTDRRAGSDAGGEQELMTEEVALVVESTLTPGEDTLRGTRGPLPETIGAPLWRRALPWGALAIALGAISAWAFMSWRRRANERARVTAFDVAWRRLALLEHGGFPTDDAIDAWYVELSDLVRRYVEDRYGLRAPELTTEEFLQLAFDDRALTANHRGLLGDFLVRCDQVKFAGHRPLPAESAQALEAARAFLNETRVVEAAS